MIYGMNLFYSLILFSTRSALQHHTNTRNYMSTAHASYYGGAQPGIHAATSEQLGCLRDLTNALEDSFNYFHKGPAHSSGTSVAPATVADAVELLNLLTALLTAPHAPETHQQVLLATFDGPTFPVLVAFVSQPLIFAAEGSATGSSLQETFVHLRITALQVLNRLSMEASGDPAASSQCVRAWDSHRVFNGLVTLLSSPATFETLRTAAIESIFVFVLRVPGSKKLFISSHTHQSIVSCLVLEPSTMVRNYLCVTLREVAVDHAHEISEPNVLNACLKLISTDDSADVRSLCIETIDLALKANTRVGGYLEHPEEIVNTLRERLDRDPSAQVIEVVAKLIENLAHAAQATSNPSLLEAYASQHVYRSLIMALRHPPQASAAVARALRYEIQYTPCGLQLGYHIVTQFQTLSALLKAAMDQSQAAGNESVAAQQVLSVELGIAISMILAQSPVNRQHLYRELHSFPLWSSSLRTALTNFLNSAAVDYFAGIDLIDVTGVHINQVHNVDWGEGMKPKKASIRALFAQQEQRVREQRAERPAGIPPTAEHEQRRQMKLTFVLLNYAVHLSLAPEEAGGTTPSQGMSTPGRASQSMPYAGAQSPNMTAMSGAPHPGSYVDPHSPMAGVPPMYTPAGRNSTTSPSRRPMFPNPRSPRSGVDMFAPPRTQKEQQEAAMAYDRFDSSFKFTQQFAEYYGKKQKQEAVYEPTPDGFVVRREKLLNPWGPIVKKQRLRSWTVQDMKEGDLFYFAIPFDDLKIFALDTVLDRAKRHMANLKKNFITTPQTAKGRRWFLNDMMANVMPKAIEFLGELRSYVEKHGGDNVRFPLFLFREKEMHLGERALHPGNLVEVTEQIRFYFSQTPGELLGVDPAYVANIEEKIRSLSTRRYGVNDDGVLDGVNVDDDDGYPGHGGLSSDSDGEM